VTAVEDEQPQAADPRRWLALGACLTTLFMTLLDVNIVVVALPSIGKSTGAHPAELQWVISAYALGFGLVPIIAGRLGDDRGRKRMLLLGTAGFIVTSAVIGFAPNPQVLIVTRFAQGLSGGLLNPQISGFVQNLFPRSERPRAFALIGAMVGTASAAGPVVGGLIIALAGTHIGWRITFLINVPVGITALILSARWLPTIPRTGQVRRLDLPGSALMALALLGVLFPAVEYDSSRDLRLFYLLIPAAILFALFFWWEAGPGRRRGYPLIDLSLFRIPSFADGCTLALIYFGCLSALPLILTLFLQQGVGYSALHAALIAAATAVAVAISSLVAGRLLPRYGSKVLVVAICVLLAGLTALMLVVALAGGSASSTAIGLLLLAPLAIAGFGMGAVSTPNQVLTYTDVDATQGSTAGGMLQTSQRIGLAIGSAVASAVFYTVALNGSPVTGAARQLRYSHAYLAALGFVTVLAVGSLLISIRSVRHGRRAEKTVINAQ
jgi:EmrB/QacA subfamily drug resistance transporter